MSALDAALIAELVGDHMALIAVIAFVAGWVLSVGHSAVTAWVSALEYTRAVRRLEGPKAAEYIRRARGDRRLS
jgi:hypothetical protein